MEARGKYRLLKTCWLDWLTILFDTCSMFKFKLWENLYYNTKYFPNLDRQRDNLVIKVWTVHRTLEIVWIGDQFALCFFLRDGGNWSVQNIWSDLWDPEDQESLWQK